MSQPSESGDAPDEPAPDESHPAAFPPSPDEPAPVPVAADAGTTRALTELLRRHPFLDLHRAAGDVANHRFRGWICFTFDFLLTLIVVALLLAILAAIAWKTLAPLPDW